MAYLALYRKYRPKNFDEIVGQEHIVRILTNQIKNSRASHAYLFCGTRGTGKTSTAKVFAKALNCMCPQGVNPCGECESCHSIDRGINLNVQELDAASNNGVDNIRELTEEVKYPPTMGKYKVYIIDEVHMLSTGAFNALLKTLEEPPPQVIFILATTDPQKIPPTIHSRCQRLDFHRINHKDTSDALKALTSSENIDIDHRALEYIARLTDGSMRDALSLLDQCAAYYYGETLTMERVLKITGSVDNDVFFRLAKAISRYDCPMIIEIIGDTVNSGKDVSQLLSDFISHLRNLLVSISVKTNTLDMSDSAYDQLKASGEEIGRDNLINYIHAFSGLQNQMRYAQNPRILLETACIKLANPQACEDSALSDRLRRLEKLLENGVSVAPPLAAVPVPKVADKAKEKKTIPKAVPDDIQKVVSSWRDFVDDQEPVLRSMLNKSFAGYLGDGGLYIVAEKGKDDHLKRRQKEINESLCERYGKEFNTFIIDIKAYESRHNIKYGFPDENAKKISKDEINGKLNGFATFEE